jgi:hypothetical protein
MKIRSYGHFKAKCQRTWKISEKHLELICKFDKVIVEEIFYHESNEYKVS